MRTDPENQRVTKMLACSNRSSGQKSASNLGEKGTWRGKNWTSFIKILGSEENSLRRNDIKYLSDLVLIHDVQNSSDKNQVV